MILHLLPKGGGDKQTKRLNLPKGHLRDIMSDPLEPTCLRIRRHMALCKGMDISDFVEIVVLRYDH